MLILEVQKTSEEEKEGLGVSPVSGRSFVYSINY